MKIKQFLSFILFKVLNINPDSILYFAYYSHNIRPGHELTKNGEFYLIRKVNNFFKGKNKVIVFDVGANEGSYSRLVSENINDSQVYAFEPNFELVNISNYGSAKIFPIGLGEQKVQANLFVSENALQEASIYEGVAKYLSPDSKDGSSPKVLEIEIDSIDEFCALQNVLTIDFLKIDTEGNEHSVLLGAKKMLLNDKIKVIQFEFNEMNVISRVFLKDFYVLLSDNFEIYRLHKNSLFPLGKYKAHNEIFVWHNLVAINKSIVDKFLLA